MLKEDPVGPILLLLRNLAEMRPITYNINDERTKIGTTPSKARRFEDANQTINSVYAANYTDVADGRLRHS
jgi:hypothetical protein